jgi:1,2-phenylacetyl-CoA epoxidase PaaB subunit
MSVRTPKPPQRKFPRWRITRIKAKAVEVGTVEAPDAESAIKRAIEAYGITDREQQKRLAAYRVG